MRILSPKQAELIVYKASKALADYVKDANLESLVLGISGGLDSAVVAGIALQAIKILYLQGRDCWYIFEFIDIDSNSYDYTKAQLLAKQLRFSLGMVDYSNWYANNPIRLPVHYRRPRFRVADGNLKCRIRMLHLYDQAQIYGGVVLDTDDLSEFLMGFWTLHGDVGDVKIIQNLTKDEVRDLGEYLGVPKEILESAPGDGLNITDAGTAQDQLKLPYTKCDYVMSRMISIGLDINGPRDQINLPSFADEMEIISIEIDEPVENVKHVVRQSLRTSFKRVGEELQPDPHKHPNFLLPSRTKIGLPEIGTPQFNDLYLKVIKNS